MTDNDKMREAFEKWYLMQPIAHKSHIVRISNGHYFGAHTETAWRAWQAAQSVPAVGDALFYASDSTPTAESQIQYDVCAYQKDYSFFPVYRKPTHFITAADLERLRKCEDALKQMLWIAHYSSGVAGYPLDGDIAEWESFPEYHAALAAIAAEGEKE